MAKIELIFRPILSGSNQNYPNLTGAYHEFLLYTSDNGVQLYASGGPKNGILTTQAGLWDAKAYDAPVITVNGVD
jgi:hypothetical protein